MSLNIDNINRLIAILRADDGRHFVMSDYAEHLEGELAGRPAQAYTVCQTALCIAGHANLERLRDTNVDLVRLGEKDLFRGQIASDRKAMQWLGIASDQEANDLFYLCSTHANIRLSNFDRLPAAIRRAAGIRVLEILRDTGEVNWHQALDDAGAVLPADANDDDDDGSYRDDD